MSLDTDNRTTSHSIAAPATRDTEARARLKTVLRLTGFRILGAAGVLWAVATLAFFAMRLVPGDPVDALLGGPGNNATEEVRQATRELNGLDRPLLVQYGSYLGKLVTGDLGDSYQLREPVAQVLGEQLGNTLVLAVLALATAWVLALALALWSARGGKVATLVGNLLEVVSAAVPHFWLGSLLILVFSVSLQWLPATSGAPGIEGLILPVLTLAIPLAGFLGQVMRESMLTAMNSPFAISSRARGESEASLSLRHALRHAALPGIGLSGWAMGSLISGAVVVETVFARPGIGRTLLQSVLVRDVPVVLGVVVLVAAIYIIVTLLSDLAERWADPRLRAA
ncbi:ABC transporter permease [Paeniglutamicibacter psychrophenolicus]|uniref:ABC transporter permease n=1 Tax=Paeniglutamicibacter psychrophenolicus TaxID=257454 RepID=UPI00277E3C39|nr:ABC transporter permease [Paeniglutamicibacter psychrophenolicus]MDQ0093335.1 peptide/nickel transport system permease protein [Paeniglutamicibacter psychrophenolicus]